MLYRDACCIIGDRTRELLSIAEGLALAFRKILPSVNTVCKGQLTTLGFQRKGGDAYKFSKKNPDHIWTPGYQSRGQF